MEVAKSSAIVNCITYDNKNLDYKEFLQSCKRVCILGVNYTPSTAEDLEDLRKDVMSRIWLTYRKSFNAIGGIGGPTTDSGWGCMLRCGQMMLSHSLIVRHLGRDWRWTKGTTNTTYWKILKMFHDKKLAPFSIHQIASMGESEGKEIGQWFGPSTVAHVLRKLSAFENWCDLALHIAMDSTVVLEDIEKIATYTTAGVQVDYHNRKQKNWKPILLFIPLRLGLSEINPCYIEPLLDTFNSEYFVGLLGGRPNHAHWFFGKCENDLLYLDPHVCQEKDFENDETYHCDYAGKIDCSGLDPSLAIGFLFERYEALHDWQYLAREKFQKLFEVVNNRPKHWGKLQHYSPLNSVTVSVSSEDNSNAGQNDNMKDLIEKREKNKESSILPSCEIVDDNLSVTIYRTELWDDVKDEVKTDIKNILDRNVKIINNVEKVSNINDYLPSIFENFSKFWGYPIQRRNKEEENDIEKDKINYIDKDKLYSLNNMNIVNCNETVLSKGKTACREIICTFSDKMNEYLTNIATYVNDGSNTFFANGRERSGGFKLNNTDRITSDFSDMYSMKYPIISDVKDR
ncbi:DgyrCDS9038 [Dimorphilus gyrociliatus]|uniref:Cysteine protease n=1 Tax=Dimorphilus gyrociliatus TaxID=2664684 RepID=A0A7I8VXF1_9ANNE|nr:DgyrCDS9038 [Dimorphilus gyrociliatus]